MGRSRSRRIVQLYDDDDDDVDEEASQAMLPLGGGGPSSGEGDLKKKKNQQEEEKAKMRISDVVGKEEETPRRRGRGRPPKRRASENDKEVTDVKLAERRQHEEEELVEEQQQRRQEASPPPLAAKPLQDKKKQQQQDVVELEHAAAAVPIGDPVMVTTTGRRGKKQKKHYASFEYNGLLFELEDFVLVEPELGNQKPYAAIIKDITGTEGGLIVTCQWFYRPEEAEIAEGKFCVARDTRELFYSFHTDDVNAESVMHKCVVHFIPENKQIPDRKRHPGFIVQKVYGAVEKKLWNLSDVKEHDVNTQQTIDILVKKTIDRIGELPDLEPPFQDTHTPRGSSTSRRFSAANEPDSNNFEKEQKTPASAKVLKNYAILARYKAITGNECRDKWLDKLLESIPLAWSKEIAARVMLRTDPGAATESSSNLSSPKIAVSVNDNEKPYGLDDVVPTIVSLERCAYEALGTDFGKYNQKLRHLWYNIKNSPKLRKRLMNKELDPPALLVMSPDELKAGLISAEKTYEPEQPRQLQMTDARCQRCQEKKVGISDVIQAGNRHRYQLECTSCGHTWFSSYDAVSSLSAADGPSTATVTGNATTVAAARAAAPVAEKEKQQQVSSFTNKDEQQVRSDP